MKKANRMKLMYVIAGLLTLVVVPLGAKNVIYKESLKQPELMPFDKECAVRRVMEMGHPQTNAMFDQAKKECQISWAEFYKSHDERIENQ